MKVAICDAGVGNLRSVVRAVEAAVAMHGRTIAVEVTREPHVIAGADFVIVPGQGSFGSFVRAIESGLGDALCTYLATGRPYLGICLGMQVLFETSAEAPGAKGLGVLPGHVVRLTPGLSEETTRPLALPHMGWNAVVRNAAGAVSAEAEKPTEGDSPYFYFAHSYVVEPSDRHLVEGITRYGSATFAAQIRQNATLGVQFHPEKSQREGLALLARFFQL